MNLRSLTLAGIAAWLIALPAAASVAPSGVSGARPDKPAVIQYAAVQCVTDDGHGRYRPCSALYKQQNPFWRESEYCMVDVGGGRYLPCSREYKAKHSKSKR
jgi:hypothetical protein